MKLFDAIFLVEIHDFGTKKSGFSASFLTHWYTRNVIFCSFFILFFEWKSAWTRNCYTVCESRFWSKKFWSKKSCFWLLSMNVKIAKILNEVCIFDDFLWWSMLNFEKVKKWSSGGALERGYIKIRGSGGG